MSINKNTAGVLAALGLVLAASAAWADEASIQKALQARIPTMKVESVTKSPFAGLYEVILDGELVYTDEKAEYFFGGNIYDIRTLPPRNVTLTRTNQIIAAAFSRARELAIKRVHGNGERTLYTFEDPNCSFCKALQRELAQVDNITIYTFPTPLLSDNSVEKSLAAWCAKDRAGAWEAMMSTGAVPDSGTACPHPLDGIAVLTQRYQIQSTPAIFLGDGTRIGGMRSAADIEKALATVR
jgi:thiol:disulfide interchange protein DsbC